MKACKLELQSLEISSLKRLSHLLYIPRDTGMCCQLYEVELGGGVANKSGWLLYINQAGENITQTNKQTNKFLKIKVLKIFKIQEQNAPIGKHLLTAGDNANTLLSRRQLYPELKVNRGP